MKRAAIVLLIACLPAIWYACSSSLDSPAGPSSLRSVLDLRGAIAVQRRHTHALLEIPGVIGTAVTALPDGRAGVLILAERSGIASLPVDLEGVPVTVRVSGRIMATSDPTERQRPALLGYSVGHPAITAGTIGARVRDALGRVYILSNNHVLANTNGATVGDPIYQPGPFDGGTAADQMASLTDFQVISFAANGANTMDAAVALSRVELLDNAVPSDDGYGMPNSTIYGDADGDGVFDDRNALLGLNVQKYGRTTRLTRGQITGVNATVTVCYTVSGFTCTRSARFVDQLIISPGGFSNGGDSGSLIVTDDGNLNPVGLLFAGSSSVTIASRIDLVLARFGVTIDGFDPPPPGPLTDVAVLGVNGPGTAVQHSTSNLSVTVKNFGNQDVTAFDVTVRDTTDQVVLGTQTVPGLVAGAAATLSFAWTPLSSGDHVLLATQALSDDRPLNDQKAATFAVSAPVTDVGVTGLSVTGQTIEGHVVSVAVTVSNTGNQPVDSFPVTLEDVTAGVTIGTQTVNSLAVPGTRTLTFSWDLAGAAIGAHTLVARHGLTDDVAANNERTASVAVSPKPTDLALIGLTGPSLVTVGDVAHVMVSVKNTGEVDVASFDVTLANGFNGPIVATQAAAGVAVGATLVVDVPWNTSGLTPGNYTLFATHTVPDAVSTNNIYGIGILVQPPADLAVTTVSAPAVVTQGNSVAVGVTVQNVGGQNVNGFNVVLSDGAGGAPIGTASVPYLAMGSSSTVTFTWNTAGAALGAHTLVATQTLADYNPANNQGSTAITVNPLSTDIAVTAVSVPATVTRGSTPTVSVTIQNTGGQPVSSSFALVLTDATAGVTIGTHTISGLAGNASATRSFSWSTTNAAVGSHTLTASHNLSDQNAANNQRSASVNVVVTPPDVALTALSAPNQVTVGDTVPVTITVQNVGGQDITSSFDVVTTDGWAGPVVGTVTLDGLGAGASATRVLNWKTAGVTIGSHTLFATQKYPDNNTSNNARAVGIAVNPPSVHVGNLNGTKLINGTVWSATVTVTVHDAKHLPVPGATVNGTWSPGSIVSGCVTNETGTCTVTLSAIPMTTAIVSYGVSGLTLPGWTYKSASNHDPDGSSNGYSIMVIR